MRRQDRKDVTIRTVVDYLIEIFANERSVFEA